MPSDFQAWSGKSRYQEFAPPVDMPDVCRLVAPERIFGNICGMVPDSLEGATDKDEIQITGYVFRVCGGPDHELFTNIGRQNIQFLIAGFQRLCERAISLGKSPNAITKNRYASRYAGSSEATSLSKERPFRRFALRAMVTDWSATLSRFVLTFIADTTSLISEATG